MIPYGMEEETMFLSPNYTERKKKQCIRIDSNKSLSTETMRKCHENSFDANDAEFPRIYH